MVNLKGFRKTFCRLRLYNLGFVCKDEENYEVFQSIYTVTRQMFKPGTFQIQACMYACHIVLFSRRISYVYIILTSRQCNHKALSIRMTSFGVNLN